MYRVVLSFLFLLVFLPVLPSQGVQQNPAPSDAKANLEDVIPLTMGNIRGHQMLYNEGWFIVTSSGKAFDFARENALISSKTAITEALHAATEHSNEYKEKVTMGLQDSVKTGKDIVVSGTRDTGEILGETHSMAKSELAYAGDSFQKAMSAFVRGNMTISSRTETERKELVGLPGNYFKTLKSDFSNVYELTEPARKQFAAKIAPEWESSFQKAGRAFQAEYERSGEESNSLMALGPILSGYLKSLYHGVVAPASKTIVRTTVAGTTYIVFLPVATTAIVAGRTVQSVGLTVYYVGKTGVKIVSPTVEGGLLSGMSLLSLGAVPVTYTAGGAWGAMNQVAFTTAGPIAGTAQAAVSTGIHSARYVGFLAYDAVKGTTEVVINQATSGIVLGYNALTAVPTHALIGVADTAVFLAWDGPRLVIASAQGRVRYGKDASDLVSKTTGTIPGRTAPEPHRDVYGAVIPSQSYSLGDLPVGTVVDLQKLRQVDGVTVNVLSTDEQVIREVLEKTPMDLRVKKNAEN